MLTNKFGINRVIEPKSAVPVTAWKLDNHKEITPYECRVSLQAIHLEPDSFQQLCNDCGFDESKIITKIMDIVQRRGKLHNPFTGSGGLLYGTIEAMGTLYQKKSPYQEGDEILCLATLTGIPLFIDTIYEIDYSYGEILVDGYGILSMESPVTSLCPSLKLSYTMATLDQGGSLHSVYTLAKRNMRILFIGKDLISTIIYIAAIRKAVGKHCHVTALLDEESVDKLDPTQVIAELNQWADAAYIIDVTQPISSGEFLIAQGEVNFDLTINCEDLTGTEVLSVLLTKEKGRLYFSRFKNSYTQAILVAESMGKEIDAYALDQFSKGYEAFTLELLTSIKEDLNRIDQCYHSQYPLPGTLRQKSKSILLPKEGRVDDFIFSSPVTDALIDETLNIADYDCNVIIQGETGVGKEKVLSLIHKNSARKAMHCVKINCATIQESLAESEFFGYEAGAFTGAQSSGKKGYFEVANGGIMFLDEIGALSLNLQSKLLRVLQENQFFKVGGINPININVRVICANNVPLRQLVEEGKFREDLYYRLNICTITVPPLRERQEDIITLAQAFLRKYCKRYGSDKELDSSALQKLVLHDWPGNVRELENLIHRSVINVKKHIISEEDIQALLHQSVYDDLILDLRQTLRRAESINFDRIVADQEKQLLTYALKKCGSTRKAAEFLHMSQPKLMRKKQKYQLT